ncbi:MAG: hypothetical protein E7385_00040 [Ruminococcaceae bacterium]|nr:hypothetical protein [Oscillospiraceae bacterium]
MSFKKIISLLLVTLLLATVALSMVACGEKDADYELKNILPDQLQNQRYYFRQGYTAETWDVKVGDNDYYLIKFKTMADGSAVRYNSGLCAQFSPKGRSDVTYSIYNITSVGGAAVTRATIFEQLVNEEVTSSFKFNELFLDSTEEGGRENFVLNKYDDVNDTVVNINKTQFNTLGYTFTKDGIDWKGNLYFIPHGIGGTSNFHLITVEAVATEWDTFAAEIEVMLQDFKQVGYEGEN